MSDLYLYLNFFFLDFCVEIVLGGSATLIELEGFCLLKKFLKPTEVLSVVDFGNSTDVSVIGLFSLSGL